MTPEDIAKTFIKRSKSGPKIIDLTGQWFGWWTVIEFVDCKNKNSRWRVRCKCGIIKVATTSHLKRGHTLSCGCYRRQLHKSLFTTHGMINTRAYRSWYSAKQRCFNKNAPNYRYYGGRGITMCDRWKNSFEEFYKDMGKRPEEMSIDRINNDGNYEPGNCRWATVKQQNNNQGTHFEIERGVPE